MDFDFYQSQAMTTRLPTACTDYALFNLAGEVGELTSLYAKGIRDGKKLDFLDNAKKEMGDILWSLAALANDWGLSLSDVAGTNLEKLASRQQRNVLEGSGDNR